MRTLEKKLPTLTGAPMMAIAIALGLVVAVWITRKDEYFLGNFAAYWLPQAAVLCVALLCKTSRRSLSGIAIAMALYLCVFNLWATEAMAWLWYLFSFPGVLLGALATRLTNHGRPLETFTAIGWVIIGIVLSLTTLFVILTA